MRRFLYAILLLCFLSGCGTTLKSKWTDFNAYYNTFYNAKKSYKAGYEKVTAARPAYNPQLPIRIHEIPVNSGAQDFQKAIEKGAEILRKYPDSKWLDDALLLIGKSYHFRSDFFSADQKYQELFRVTGDPDLKQKSVIWRGRLLLDMEIPEQGISYMTEKIHSEELEWRAGALGEARTVLAELYVAVGDYEAAITELESSLYLLESDIYKARGFFLLGQLYDAIGSPESALFAFRQVGEYYSDYELQYLAQRKRAETARKIGAYDQAFDTFSEMSRDDKNTDFKAELDYEKARTLHEQGEYQRAEELYREILYEREARPDAITLARIYFGLAELYRYGFNDFKMAAAYYDTASMQNVSRELLPDSFAASELADSFGRYAELKEEIALKDSLLWVANLDRKSLDSLLIVLRQQKLAKLQQELRKQEQRQNTLVTIDRTADNRTNTGTNGFLNHKNPSLVASSAVQFRAVWGNRPLVDNWRVREVYEASLNSQTIADLENSSVINQSPATQVDLSIDLSQVPFQPEEKDSVRAELANLNYQLANLFFLSLEEPDSAAYYFNKVITKYPDSREVPVSYYSLSELSLEAGDAEASREYAYELIMNYPGSEYSVRLAEFFGIPLTREAETTGSITAEFSKVLEEASLSDTEKAERGTALFRSHKEEEGAEAVLYQTIRLYVEAGRKEPVYLENIDDWYRLKGQGARVSDAEASGRDSTNSPNDAGRLFPYRGASWDSARVNLLLFKEHFPDSRLIQSVKLLYEEIRPPASVSGGSVGRRED